MQSRRMAEREERLAGVVPSPTEIAAAPPVQALIPFLQDEIRLLNPQPDSDPEYNSIVTWLPPLMGKGAFTTEAGRTEMSDQELLQRFGRGEMPFILLYADPGNRYEQDALENLKENVLISEDQVSHYTLIRDPDDPSVLLLRNNWFVPFSREERAGVTALLKSAQNLDERGMAQALSLYYNLKDLAAKTYSLRASETFYCSFPGSESLREAFEDVLSSYNALREHIFGAIRALISGNPDAEQLVAGVAPLLEAAQRTFDNAHLRIANAFRIYDPLQEDPELARAVNQIRNPSGAGWSPELSFTPLERDLFELVYKNYLSLLSKITGRSSPLIDEINHMRESGEEIPAYLQEMEAEERAGLKDMTIELAAFILGIPPGTVLHPPSSLPITIMGLSEEDQRLIREFFGAASLLQLFLAKAKFLSIEAEYREYMEEYMEYRSDWISRRTPAAGFPEAGSMAAAFDMAVAGGEEVPSDVAQFHARREEYARELGELRKGLVAYGKFVEETLRIYIPGTRAALSEHPECFSSLHSLLDREGGAIPAGSLERMIDDSSAYLEALRSGIKQLEQITGVRLTDPLLGSWWEYVDYYLDSMFAEMGEFLRSYGVFGQILATAAGGMIGLIAGGPAGAATGARLGFAIATIAEAPVAAAVGLHALTELGEGPEGARAYDDLAMSAFFLMSGGMAAARGTRLGWRAFSTTSFGLGAGLSAARIYEDLRRGDNTALLNALFDFGVMMAGGYMFFRGIRGIQQVRAGALAPLAAAEIRVATPFGFENIQLPTLAEWATFPYTARGVASFSLIGAGFETALHPDEIALILARDGVEGLQRHFNETYLKFANSMPVINIVLSGALTGLVAGAGRVIGMLEPSPAGPPTALEGLQIPTSNPGLSACMEELGSSTNAFYIAKNYGLDLAGDRELLRRIYTIALSGRALSKEEAERIIGSAYLNELGESSGRFIEELLSSTNNIRATAAELASGAAVGRTTRQRVMELVRLAKARASEFSMEIAGLTAGAFGSYDVMELVPAYRERVAATNYSDRFRRALFSDDITSYFLIDVVRNARFSAFRRGYSYEEQRALDMAAATVFMRIEQGLYPEFSEALKGMVPDQQSRFNLVYAAAVALLGKREGRRLGLADLNLFIEELGNLVWNATVFFATPTNLSNISADPSWHEKRLDWSGMGFSDFFLAANYLLSAGEVRGMEEAGKRLSAIVRGFAEKYSLPIPSAIAGLGGHYLLDKTMEAIKNPQFARVVIAALHQSFFLDRSEEWAYKSVCKLVEIAEAEGTGISGIASWRGEIIAEIFASNPFSSLNTISNVNNAALVDILMDIYGGGIYPARVYASGGSE